MYERQFSIPDAEAALRAADPRMARLIDTLGPCTLGGGRYKTPFDALVRSIVYQQLSGKAAGKIHRRLQALFPGHRPQPEGMLALAEGELRAAGLSGAKIRALRDLSQRTRDGTLPDSRQIGALSNEAIYERLLAVRGVGPWTIDMLLIFDLGRADVLPTGDLAIRKGYARMVGRRQLPRPETVRRRGRRWRPWRSVASWYLWQVVDDGESGAW